MKQLFLKGLIFLKSLFESDKATSSSRFIAFVTMATLNIGILYFYLWVNDPRLHISVFKHQMIFILVLVGIIKISDLIALWQNKP